MDMFYFPFARRKSSSSSKKKKKAKKENWFERITVDQLKQLCRAAKLTTSGTKKVLVDRLLENETTSEYAEEGGGMYKFGGVTVEHLKARCKTRNLIVSGTKFELVLRLVQYDQGSAPEIITKATKRSAPDDGEDGQPKKKRKPTKPDLDKIYDRVKRKIESVYQKKYQSHYGSKTHSPEVYSCIHSILDKEVMKKEFIQTDPLFALSVAKSALTSLTENFETIQRPGYDDYGSICDFSRQLKTIIEAAKPFMNVDVRTDTIGWIQALEDTFEPYCLGESFGEVKEGENKRYLQNSLDILKDQNTKS